jgi:endonuclease YncB( thermonuclease family)
MTGRTHLIAAAALIVALLPVAAGAASISGRARVIDGSTIAIGGQQIRLFGISAPDTSQSCTLGGRIWRCGADVTTALIGQAGDKMVTCDERGIDTAKHVVAICHVGTVDLADWMVRNGWALAARRESMMYVSAEIIARNAHVGLWRVVAPTAE